MVYSWEFKKQSITELVDARMLEARMLESRMLEAISLWLI